MTTHSILHDRFWSVYVRHPLTKARPRHLVPAIAPLIPGTLEVDREALARTDRTLCGIAVPFDARFSEGEFATCERCKKAAE